jgi:hypothetical protein
MKDKTLKSIYIGFFAVLIKDIFDWIYILLGFKGISMAKVATGTFVSAENVSTFTGLIIGYTAHYAVVGILEFLFFALLVITNKNYGIQKGIFWGLSAWLFLAGLLLTLGVSRYTPTNPSKKLMLLLDHIVFGSVLGLLIPVFILDEEKYKSSSLLNVFQPAFKKQENDD